MLQDSDTIRISDVSEAVVHGILEVISDGIWDWHANTGFVYRNPGWYQMLGYEPHSLNNTVFTWENGVSSYVHYHQSSDLPANMTNARPLAGGILKMDAAMLATVAGIESLFTDGFE